MTQRITRPWSRVFEQNGSMLLQQMAASSKKAVSELLEEIESSSPPNLRPRFQTQCRLANQEAEKAINNLIENIGMMIHKEQKNISRLLAPYIKTELRSAYAEIVEQSGTGAGSGGRLKQNLQNRIDHHCPHIFFDACDSMTRSLDRLAEVIGVMVRVALSALSDEIEVNIATVWNTPLNSANDGDDGNCIKWREGLVIRGDVATKVGVILSQLNVLAQAGADGSDPRIGTA